MLTRIAIVTLITASGLTGVASDKPDATTTRTNTSQITSNIPPVHTTPPKQSSEMPLVDLTGIDFGVLHEQLFGKCGQWYVTARQAGWPVEEWPTVSKVMWRESRCDTKAWNGADAGLMQINRIHTRYVADMGMVWPDAMFNPYRNLLYARTLWERAGWQPWIFKGVVPG